MISKQEAPLVLVQLLLALIFALTTIRLHLGPVEVGHLRNYVFPAIWSAYWLFQITRFL